MAINGSVIINKVKFTLDVCKGKKIKISDEKLICEIMRTTGTSERKAREFLKAAKILSGNVEKQQETL